MEALLVVLVIFGLIGWAIGRTKGREGAGFILGALLGPIGWAILAIGRDYRRKCPECKAAVPDGARKCMHCGSELRAAAARG